MFHEALKSTWWCKGLNQNEWTDFRSHTVKTFLCIFLGRWPIILNQISCCRRVFNNMTKHFDIFKKTGLTIKCSVVHECSHFPFNEVHYFSKLSSMNMYFYNQNTYLKISKCSNNFKNCLCSRYWSLNPAPSHSAMLAPLFKSWARSC